MLCYVIYFVIIKLFHIYCSFYYYYYYYYLLLLIFLFNLLIFLNKKIF